MVLIMTCHGPVGSMVCLTDPTTEANLTLNGHASFLILHTSSMTYLASLSLDQAGQVCTVFYYKSLEGQSDPPFNSTLPVIVRTT